MAKVVALTTKDNPYDPFDDFKKWYMFDMDHGYNTCGYLASRAMTSDALTLGENEYELEQAIDEIMKTNFRGIYCKVVKDVPDSEDEYDELVEA